MQEPGEVGRHVPVAPPGKVKGRGDCDGAARQGRPAPHRTRRVDGGGRDPECRGMPTTPRFLAWLCPLLAGPWIASAEPVRIACVGDSITEGAGLSNASQESYPARLQRLLGTNEFTVRNYGVSGRTLLKKGDFPYWKEAAYTQSRAWKPHVVVIKLGTNDSKPYNWRHGTNFVSEFEEFVGSYAGLETRPRIILCTPAPVYNRGAFDIQPGVVATNVAPAVRDLASRLGLEVIDLHERLAGHAEWFPDTVHPNTRGMAVMAAVVLQSLKLMPDSEAAAEVEIRPISGGRAALQWSAAHRGWVMQSANLLTGSPANWTVLDSIPYADAASVRLTNRPTAARFYRLWKP